MSFSACCTAFTCSALPPAARPDDLPLFISLLEPDDIVPEVLPAPDFMSAEDEPAPVPDVLLLPVCGLAAGDEDFCWLPLEVEPDAPDDFVSVLGLAAGALVSVPFVSAPVLAGVLVSALEPLPPVLAPALDPEPLAAPLAPLAPPLWANADVASMAPATVSAKALIHVFITVLLMLVCVV